MPEPGPPAAVRRIPTGSSSVLVLMGVAGSGKSTVMAELHRTLAWPGAEGDSFHSPANVQKLAAGIPLTDGEREAWLRAIASWIGDREAAGSNALLACSALKRSYRDVLREGRRTVCFVHLVGPSGQLEKRIAQRAGRHAAASILDSQLADLEPLAPDEAGLTIATDRPVGEVAAAIKAWLDYR